MVNQYLGDGMGPVEGPHMSLHLGQTITPYQFTPGKTSMNQGQSGRIKLGKEHYFTQLDLAWWL